ncbi:MAG: L,D-transpeptidase family protein [Prochlorococcaceae cyanobacterium]
MPSTGALTGVLEALAFFRDGAFAQRRFERYGNVFETSLAGQRLVFIRGGRAIGDLLAQPEATEGWWPESVRQLLGSRFEEGYTPLGRFRVNGILSDKQFVMEPALIAQSGKTEAELGTTLFKNMNAIDFSGDGETGEYGIGYVSLAPLSSVKQPFAFNTYNGKFRWYSFAIHGSNNDQRIGQQVTGGCVNVAEPVLQTLLDAVKLGQEVVISANGPCTP